MQAGRLNSRVEIQRKVAIEDEVGATSYVWQSIGKLWANVRHISGAEAIKGDGVASIVKASIRVRFKAAIQPDQRVVLADGAIYDIKAVLPDVNDRVFIDLVCERVDSHVAQD